MGSFSDYLEKKLLDHVLKVAPYTVPSNLYVGAFTIAPDDTGGGTEKTIGVNGYARVLINSWNAATGTPTISTNAGVITFPQDTGADWGTILAAAIFDSAVGGNMLVYSVLSPPKLIEIGDVLEIPISSFQVQLD
jgi:hypothetical protein